MEGCGGAGSCISRPDRAIKIIPDMGLNCPELARMTKSAPPVREIVVADAAPAQVSLTPAVLLTKP